MADPGSAEHRAADTARGGGRDHPAPAASPANAFRGRRRLPGHTGTTPVGIVLVVLMLATFLFAFSPTLSPSDLLAGRFMAVSTPSLIGLSQDNALVELERSRLRGEVRFVHSSQVLRGAVVAQRPSAGASVDRGTAVVLQVSLGPGYVTVPTLVGTKRTDGLRALDRLGLEVNEKRVSDEDIPAGQIMSQKPAAGTVVERSSRVAIVVSTGPRTRAVPLLAGVTIEGAAFMLGRAGFTLDKVSFVDSATVRRGDVVGSDPPAGSVLPRDAPVAVAVSSGPPPVAVPALTDMKQEAAVAALSRLGLNAGLITQATATRDPADDTVLNQYPAAGTQLRAGDVVTITVRRALPTPNVGPAPSLPPVTAATTTQPPPTTPPVPGGA
ncbi:MAG: PASTA domain-containing protein [Microthrixaceae bacterium]